MQTLSTNLLDELDSEAEATGPDGMKLGGWSSYQEYLKSASWRDLRDEVLARDFRTCIDCGTSAAEVHHRHYPEHVDQTCVDDLVSLCSACHDIRPRTGTPMTFEERQEMTGMSNVDEDFLF